MISMESTDMNQPPWSWEFVLIVYLFLNKTTPSIFTYPNDFHSYLTHQLVIWRTGAISCLCFLDSGCNPGTIFQVINEPCNVLACDHQPLPL